MACVQIIQALREKSSEIKDNQRQCVCEQAAAQMENKSHRVYASSCLRGPWGLKFHSFVFCPDLGLGETSSAQRWQFPPALSPAWKIPPRALGKLQGLLWLQSSFLKSGNCSEMLTASCQSTGQSKMLSKLVTLEASGNGRRPYEKLLGPHQKRTFPPQPKAEMHMSEQFSRLLCLYKYPNLKFFLSSSVLRQAASASPGDVLGIQIPRIHLRLTESATLRVGTRTLCFQQAFQEF